MQAIRAAVLSGLVLAFVVLGQGLGAAESAAHSGFAEHDARTSGRDVKIPNALVDRIEQEYKAFLMKQEGAHDKVEIMRSLINITAELTQNRTAALHENTRIRMPTGGGVIDLSEIVTPLRGAFRMKLLTANARGEPLSTSRVFFVSHSKVRILGGEEYGDGCDKFMEISSRYHKKWEDRGFEVYTADQRYLSVLGGTFIFVDYSKDALSVGSVTFSDSRYPDLLCE
jgi:hypothetical protein